MEAFVREQAVYVIRLLAAMVCGGLIGYERHSRRKTAGLRTHVIIALASALMMILSKYGFFDVLGSYEDVKLDPSRMASGIVTAIGFIGSGIIFSEITASRARPLPRVYGLPWAWAWQWGAACTFPAP